MPKEKFAAERHREPIRPKTQNQARYMEALDAEVNDENGDDAFVFALGAAGTGKTWLAAMYAADGYLSGRYSQIIITRPTLACGEEMGALPGELEEKYDPWVQTVTEPLKDRIGKNIFQCDWKKKIHAEPLQFMRGKTFDNSFIIVDEAQNLTIEQAKMVVTRIGEGSKMVLAGDTNQIDLKMNYRTGEREQSGLNYLVHKLMKQHVSGVEIITFTKHDCVRAAACKKILYVIEAGRDE